MDRTRPLSAGDRRGTMRALAAALPPLVRRAFGRRGFAAGGIVTDWAAVVGPEIAARSAPIKIAYPQGQRRNGTLHVQVAGALALELQHLEPLVIERVNGYLGYGAVTRLKIRQGPLPSLDAGRRPAAPARPLDPAEEAALAGDVAAVPDEPLRRALAGLGRALRRTGSR
ncbi:MAG TPA: DciA family protein [Dongiaceae bacterium]|nr:DciA family protein [Dongiaceae bacterium]